MSVPIRGLWSSRCSFCDFMGNPYPEDVQFACRHGDLSVLRIPNGVQPTPSGLRQYPPTATAAAWEANEKGLTENSMLERIEEAMAKQEVLEQQAEAGVRDTRARVSGANLLMSLS